MRVDSHPRKSESSNFERLLADAFRQAGWKVARKTQLGERRPDLLVRRGKLAYAVELKSAPEGRRDRLIPLLAKAILQAQALVRESSAVAPLAVVASARVPEALADEVRNFAIEYAPGVAAGVMDLEGLRAFVGAGLEGLNASRQSRPRHLPPQSDRPHHLFSDLNQWMLKVLLAPQVPEELLSVPRGEYRNASELARASGVSVMSAFRLCRQLQMEGFLERSGERIRLVRVEELMGQPPDVYVRIPSAPQSVFRAAVRRDGVLASDILQVWLDVADHPARGKAQALEIERRVLRPLLAGKQ